MLKLWDSIKYLLKKKKRFTVSYDMVSRKPTSDIFNPTVGNGYEEKRTRVKKRVRALSYGDARRKVRSVDGYNIANISVERYRKRK